MANETNARRRSTKAARERYWRSLNIFALRALTADYEAAGKPVPGIIYQRTAVELSKMGADPLYAAKVIAAAGDSL